MRHAWRSLPWGERWRLNRAAGLGRCVSDPRKAAIVVWRTERALRQARWQIPFIPVFLLGLYALLRWVWDESTVVLLFFAAFHPVFYAMVRVPLMRRAVRLNRQVLADAEEGRPTRVPFEPPDARLRFAWAVGAIAAIVLLAGLMAVEAHTPRVPPPPSELADGGPLGDVPPAVEALVDGQLVAGRMADRPPAGAEPCDVVEDWEAGLETSRLVVLPRSMFVVQQGTGRAPALGSASWTEPEQRPQVGGPALDPSRLIALCEYRPGGALTGYVVAQEGRTASWFSGSGRFGGLTPDGRIMVRAELLVPDQATWALLRTDDWTLAVPVAGLPVVLLRWEEDPERWIRDAAVQRPVRFVDDDGTVLLETVVGL